MRSPFQSIRVCIDITAPKPTPGKGWVYVGPHVMVVLPASCRDALLGVNRDISKGTGPT